MLSPFTVTLAITVIVVFLKYYKRTKKELAEDVINVTEYILQGTIEPNWAHKIRQAHSKFQEACNPHCGWHPCCAIALYRLLYLVLHLPSHCPHFLIPPDARGKFLS